MNTQKMYSMNIHKIYNSSSINYNEILLKKKFIYFKTGIAHVKRKRHHKQF